LMKFKPMTSSWRMDGLSRISCGMGLTVWLRGILSGSLRHHRHSVSAGLTAAKKERLDACKKRKRPNR
jgi:hypothetical protein